MSFLSDTSYNSFLEERIRSLDDPTVRTHTRQMIEHWREQYRIDRLVERAAELLASEQTRPNMLSLRCEADLQLLPVLMQRHRFNGRLFRGFLAADELWGSLAPECSSPFPIRRASDWHDDENTVVLTFSEDRPFRSNGRDRGNDYLEHFIDLCRFQGVREALNSHQDKTRVLYPLYREIHTVSMMARCVRQKDERLHSISLSSAALLNPDFDFTLVEPFFYLWPLVFRMVDPAIVHLNVGWGIQALALSAFLPDPKRTVVDFYEVLSFLPDAFFERTHSSAAQVRSAEEHYFKNYDHIIHLCSDEISTKLAQKYDSRASITSVTEYLQEPTYNAPPRNDGEIRLVYGGAMLATDSPDNFYYHPFLKAVRYFTRENLRLYIYNSPYLDGMGENTGLQSVIERHGLANVHACKPLKLEDFTRQIAAYDYGIFLLMARDMNAGGQYNYFMATKFLTYLRAGLPVIIDADNRYMAGLVERYNIGVVLHDRDLENVPSILNNADLPSLKRNVLEFRREFSIDRGGAKVLKMYHEILERADRRCVVSVSGPAPKISDKADQEPAFSGMIESMARDQNRLYYRDQSARTLSSLAGLARQFNPSVIVELGTLAGLSLRAWLASTSETRIYAVDLSFRPLNETIRSMPVDLSRVTLLEQDILRTDFSALWTSQDRVIFFVDAHNLPNVPIMEHVLTTALLTLPDGSIVVVDDLWFSEERLTPENARDFLESRVLGEIDELQCFNGHFAPYHDGGSFMGFAEVIPLLEFVNKHGITLVHDRGGKHAFFVWKREYLSQRPGPADEGSAESRGLCGSVAYNPLESVPAGSSLSEMMHQIADIYRERGLREAAESLSEAVRQYPHDEGLCYGLAVCLARAGMLSQARDVLALNLNDSTHVRYRRLFEDLVRRAGPCEAPAAVDPPRPSNGCGVTIFAMPKPFIGHVSTIQKNAIRSWARLNPAPEIILFGDEPGIREMAEEVGARHIPDIHRNEFGTPLVNRLFQTAQDYASCAVLAYVNADMVLFQDFAEAAQKVQSRFASFLLIGQRWDIAILDEIDFDRSSWRQSLLQQVEEHAMLHAECGLDYFVFRNGLWPEIPPFAIGRTAWDNWLVMAPHKRGVPVVDGTDFITAIHQDHDYGHVGGGRHEAWNGIEAARNHSLAGQADRSGLTTGATWVLRKNGTLVESRQRAPQYITAPYRDQRSAWLLKDARRLIVAGAKELAACKCEEALTCLDVWLELQRLGHAQSEFMDHRDIAERYVTSYVLLAQCHMQMGCYEQVVAAYTRLLENHGMHIPAARRDDILRVRDRLARHLEGSRPLVCPSVAHEPRGTGKFV